MMSGWAFSVVTCRPGLHGQCLLRVQRGGKRRRVRREMANGAETETASMGTVSRTRDATLAEPPESRRAPSCRPRQMASADEVAAR